MKTRLLKKWRNEAWNRIGVFQQADGKYRIVFDKSVVGDVSGYDKYPLAKGFQVVCEGIEDFSEAVAPRLSSLRARSTGPESVRQFLQRRRTWVFPMRGFTTRDATSTTMSTGLTG